jgi:2-polyprenyl-3-methyl-5-hydroxy-6-metoxy-1,4-benzoquinol methylase
MGYYKEDYFNWQKEIGEFEGQIGLFKFKDYIKPTDSVIDFGCGGGYLLRNLSCGKKIGIDPNKTAQETAKRNGLEVYSSIEEIPDNFADVVISNHVLEHVLCPFESLSLLRRKVKVGGKLIFVVPHHSPCDGFRENDFNQHLYTWSPLTLGNLFKAAGYNIVKVDTIRHKWPPGYKKIRKLFGRHLFHFASRIYAIFRNSYQIRVIAEKTVSKT